MPFIAICTSSGAADTLRLFNGKDLSNFYTWLADSGYQDPDKVFSVVDEIDGAPAIRVSGTHWGAFITKEEYSNYHLTVEFRWGLLTWGERRGRAKDSGVLLHCQAPDGNTQANMRGPWMRSIECQIIQGGVGDFILVAGFDASGTRLNPGLTVTATKDRDGEDVYSPSAAARAFTSGRINWFGRDPDWKDALGFRGREDVESPNGQWTRLEVVCDGDKITNIVNGKVVNEGTKSTLTRGKIIFQSEGAEIFFRRIDLQFLK
jgi:3-keto-disaccharide hydrolase